MAPLFNPTPAQECSMQSHLLGHPAVQFSGMLSHRHSCPEHPCAEIELKNKKRHGRMAKQRAEVLQSTQRFFSEQQQNKPAGGKIQKVGDGGNKPPEVMADASGACQDKVEEKPNPTPTTAPKPVRTGPIKPQAIKTEETKS